MGGPTNVDRRCAGYFRRYRGQHPRRRNWPKNSSRIDFGTWRVGVVTRQSGGRKEPEKPREIAKWTRPNPPEPQNGRTGLQDGAPDTDRSAPDSDGLPGTHCSFGKV